MKKCVPMQQHPVLCKGAAFHGGYRKSIIIRTTAAAIHAPAFMSRATGRGALAAVPMSVPVVTSQRRGISQTSTPPATATKAAPHHQGAASPRSKNQSIVSNNVAARRRSGAAGLYTDADIIALLDAMGVLSLVEIPLAKRRRQQEEQRRQAQSQRRASLEAVEDAVDGVGGSDDNNALFIRAISSALTSCEGTHPQHDTTDHPHQNGRGGGGGERRVSSSSSIFRFFDAYSVCFTSQFVFENHQLSTNGDLLLRRYVSEAVSQYCLFSGTVLSGAACKELAACIVNHYSLRLWAEEGGQWMKFMAPPTMATTATAATTGSNKKVDAKTTEGKTEADVTEDPNAAAVGSRVLQRHEALEGLIGAIHDWGRNNNALTTSSTTKMTSSNSRKTNTTTNASRFDPEILQKIQQNVSLVGSDGTTILPHDDTITLSQKNSGSSGGRSRLTMEDLRGTTFHVSSFSSGRSSLGWRMSHFVGLVEAEFGSAVALRFVNQRFGLLREVPITPTPTRSNATEEAFQGEEVEDDVQWDGPVPNFIGRVSQQLAAVLQTYPLTSVCDALLHAQGLATIHTARSALIPTAIAATSTAGGGATSASTTPPSAAAAAAANAAGPSENSHASAPEACDQNRDTSLATPTEEVETVPAAATAVVNSVDEGVPVNVESVDGVDEEISWEDLVREAGALDAAAAAPPTHTNTSNSNHAERHETNPIEELSAAMTSVSSHQPRDQPRARDRQVLQSLAASPDPKHIDMIRKWRERAANQVAAKPPQSTQPAHADVDAAISDGWLQEKERPPAWSGKLDFSELVGAGTSNDGDGGAGGGAPTERHFLIPTSPIIGAGSTGGAEGGDDGDANNAHTTSPRQSTVTLRRLFSDYYNVSGSLVSHPHLDASSAMTTAGAANSIPYVFPDFYASIPFKKPVKDKTWFGGPNKDARRGVELVPARIRSAQDVAREGIDVNERIRRFYGNNQTTFKLLGRVGAGAVGGGSHSSSHSSSLMLQQQQQHAWQRVFATTNHTASSPSPSSSSAAAGMLLPPGMGVAELLRSVAVPEEALRGAVAFVRAADAALIPQHSHHPSTEHKNKGISSSQQPDEEVGVVEDVRRSLSQLKRCIAALPAHLQTQGGEGETDDDEEKATRTGGPGPTPLPASRNADAAFEVTIPQPTTQRIYEAAIQIYPADMPSALSKSMMLRNRSARPTTGSGGSGEQEGGSGDATRTATAENSPHVIVAKAVGASYHEARSAAARTCLSQIFADLDALGQKSIY